MNSTLHFFLEGVLPWLLATAIFVFVVLAFRGDTGLYDAENDPLA